MSKKDYQLIARVVAGLKDDGIRDYVCEEFIAELSRLNAVFDASKFRKACNTGS